MGAPLGLLPLLLAVGVWRDLSLLLHRPVAAGLDGYYYVLQVDALLNEGRFHFPNSTPLAFLFLTGVRLLTGDTVLAVKLGGVALHALLCLGLFALVARATRSLWLGVTAGALAAASQLHLFMVAEFIKNLCALTLLCWGGWCVVRAAEARAALRFRLLSLVAVAAAAFSHRSAVFVAALTCASVLLARGMMSPGPSPRWRARVAVAAALALWCAPLLAARQTLLGLPPWLANELTGGAVWPVSEIASFEKIALLVACPATLLVVNIFRERLPDGPAVTMFGAVALLGLLLTLNPFLNYQLGLVGIAVRLSCLAYVQLAVIVPGLVWMLRHVSGETSAYSSALTAFLLVILYTYEPLPLGARPNFMADREQLVRGLRAMRRPLEPDALVLAPHGDQFVVMWALGVASQQRWPDDESPRVVYWLLRNIRAQELDDSMLVLTTEAGGSHAVMVRAEDLRRRLAEMTAAERMRLFVSNSHLRKKYGTDVPRPNPTGQQF